MYSNRWNWSDLSTKGMCSTTYKVLDIMKGCSFMNLYMYQMFLSFYSGKANLGCDTSCASNLFSRDIRSSGFSKVGVSFWELMTETWFTMDKMSIPTECIPLQSIGIWLLSWNMIMKKFLSCIRALSSLERWCTVLFICTVSHCKDISMSLIYQLLCKSN